MQSIQDIQKIIADKCTGLVMPQHTDAGHYYLHTQSGETYASVTTKCGILEAPHLKAWAAGLAVDHVKEKIMMQPNSIDWDVLKTSAVLVHKDLFETAGDIGTRGHHVIEAWLKDWMDTGIKPTDIRKYITDADPRVFAIARSAEMFCRDFEVLPVASELLVASKKHKFAGTLDSLLMIFIAKEKGNPNCPHDYLPLSRTKTEKVKCVLCGRTGEYEFALGDWKSSNMIEKPEYAMQTSAYWYALNEMTGLKPKSIYVIRLDKAQAKYEIRKVTNKTTAFKAFLNTAKVYDWLKGEDNKLEKVGSRERITIAEMLQNNG